MIEVTKLGGERIFVNADHIECVEAQPDTALVLNNGKRIVIKEDVAEVMHRVVKYQQLVRLGAVPLAPVGEKSDHIGAATKAVKAD
jgi:flagellar protein FlbD